MYRCHMVRWWFSTDDKTLNIAAPTLLIGIVSYGFVFVIGASAGQAN